MQTYSSNTINMKADDSKTSCRFTERRKLRRESESLEYTQIASSQANYREQEGQETFSVKVIEFPRKVCSHSPYHAQATNKFFLPCVTACAPTQLLLRFYRLWKELAGGFQQCRPCLAFTNPKLC
jgi:hypothetical protein